MGDVVTPLADVPRARQDMTRDEVLGIARRHRIPAVCVEEPGPQRRLIGYVRVIDLAIAPSDSVGPVRPLVRLHVRDTHLDAVMRLQNARENLAQVVDGEGKMIGIVTASRLREPLFQGGK